MSDDDFFAAYDRLSHAGKCDGAGGMEYRRVLREWHESGCPPFLDAFIVARANALWDGTGREQLN